jgi:RND family efflux transporter MFP subunit
MRIFPRLWHRLRFAAVCGAALALLAGCTDQAGPGQAAGGGPEPAAEPSRKPALKTVRAEQITVRDLGDPIVAEGTVHAAEVFWVTARYGGVVQEIVKKAGDKVTEGEIIVKLTSEELRKDLSRAQAAHQAALKVLNDAKKSAAELAALNNKSLSLATAEYNRARNDYDLGLISESELQQAEQQMERIRSEIALANKQQDAIIASYQQEVNLAAAEVSELTRAMDELHVRSTVSGMISQIPLAPGMRVGLGTQVALIEKTDRVRISVPIPEELIRYVRGRQEFIIESSGTQTTAQAVSLADVRDESIRGYPLILETGNTDMELRSGMKVKVYVTDESQRHNLAVPENAILMEDGAPHIFVIRGDRVEKRRVLAGRVHDGYQEVLSGAEEHEWLAVTGITSLKDQEQVRVLEQRVEKS